MNRVLGWSDKDRKKKGGKQTDKQTDRHVLTRLKWWVGTEVEEVGKWWVVSQGGRQVT